MELGLAATSGNSETETLSVDMEFGFESNRTEFEIAAGGLQADTTSFIRTAERSPTGEFSLVEEPSTSLGAEEYYATLHFRHKFGPAGLFWFLRAEWDRDVPSGIRNRYSGIGGVGTDWIDREDLGFWAEYGWTFNRERREVEGLPGAANFPGLRLEWEFWWQISMSTKIYNHLVVNQNLEMTEDLRARMLQELQVSISEHFSLSIRLILDHDDDPPFRRVPIVEGGSRTGEFFEVPLEKLDTRLITSLVFEF